MNEDWKKIPGAPQYEASSLGRIRKNEKVLHQWIRTRGYFGVRFNGKSTLVSRLVAMAFHGKPPTTKPECMHLDGNSKNNRPENLRWGSRADNMAMERGNEKCSHPDENNPNVKLTRKDVEEIRYAYDNRKGFFWGRRKMCAKFGIGEAQCYRIASRRTGGWT